MRASTPEDARDGNWHWLVDPLDGTRRFIRGSEEFTVNIALVFGGKPVLGVVDAPAMGTVYFGHMDGGAFLCERGSGAPVPISVRRPPVRPVRVLAGRSHTVSAVELYVAALGGTHWRRISSSLKFCLIARGEADVYPRMETISEWDTAAGQAVLESAGGAVVDLKGRPLRYGKESNRVPPFIACSDPLPRLAAVPPPALSSLQILTLRDFAVARQKAEILGNLTGREAHYTLLKSECQAKPNKLPLGFVT